MEVKRFKSSTDKEVRVASTSGHVRIIGNEWVELDQPDLQSMAYAAGCISEDMIVNKEIDNVIESGMLTEVNRLAALKEEVRNVIQTALDDNNLDAFTKHNKPKVSYIRANVKEKVPNHILDEVWGNMTWDGQLNEVKVNPDKELMSDIT